MPKAYKSPRKLSPYNVYMSKELRRVKVESPSMNHKDAFRTAAYNWRFSPLNPKAAEALEGTAAATAASAKGKKLDHPHEYADGGDKENNEVVDVDDDSPDVERLLPARQHRAKVMTATSPVKKSKKKQ
ncbi:hypothetical protein H9P43_001367 [Blastocladiella emersonii ATCC 22665]|nr:hypothetical protein H9P43_001367 [Blastocladiella emersonii ATCC 22665]